MYFSIQSFLFNYSFFPLLLDFICQAQNTNTTNARALLRVKCKKRLEKPRLAPPRAEQRRGVPLASEALQPQNRNLKRESQENSLLASRNKRPSSDLGKQSRARAYCCFWGAHHAIMLFAYTQIHLCRIQLHTLGGYGKYLWLSFIHHQCKHVKHFTKVSNNRVASL